MSSTEDHEPFPLSVVIPTKDRPDRLAQCLSVLAASIRGGDEIIVVDSASKGDDTRDVAMKAGVVYVRAPRPGASLARNIGWRIAAHPIVAFVDDDVRVSPRWAEVVREATRAQGRDFVTGSIRAAEAVGGRGTRLEAEEARALDLSTRGPIGASCNLAVRKTALEAVGGFDERFGPATWTCSAEDGDLFDRLFLAGFTGWYEPDAEVVHDDRRSRREQVRLGYRYGKGAGARLARLTHAAPQRARREATDLVWRGGVLDLGSLLKSGNEWAALVTVALLAGQVVGYVRGFFVFRPRARCN